MACRSLTMRKKGLWETALQDKDNQILAASRAVEDANKPSPSDSSEDTMLLIGS